MLAYLLWHRPQEGVERDGYESAAERFHRSLAHTPPAGFRGSALYRMAELPWFRGSSYEDWYLIDDFTALGVLNAAAVAQGHRGAHDELARRYGMAAGGLYRLIEGSAQFGGERIATASSGSAAEPVPGAAPANGTTGVAPAAARSRRSADLAIWISRPPDAPGRELGELLGDGMDPARSSLWRRALVLGPAPEYCVLAPEAPAGVSSTRLPVGWSAFTVAREPMWQGRVDG